MRYSMPPSTEKIEYFQENIHDETTMEELYISYQTTLGQMHLNSDEYSEVIQHHVRKIYRRSNLEWNNPTGPDDPGYYDRAYKNEHNPFIPEALRAYRYDDRSTDHSLAWIALHLEYA